MPDQRSLWQWIDSYLQQGSSVVLMMVVSSRGSSPGKAAAKMALADDGSSMGTIGGGAVEYELIQKAAAMLDSRQFLPLLLTKVHHPAVDADQSGMICGGQQTIALYPCAAMDTGLVQRLAVSAQANCGLMLQATAQGLSMLENLNGIRGSHFEQQDERDWCYQEAIGSVNSVYLIGGGHVSLALSKVLAMLDFDIAVLDERGSLETMRNNPYAAEKKVVSYQHIWEQIPEGKHVFVLVMTHSHRTDQLVVQKLAGKRVNYIGVLGSKTKITLLKRNLRQQRIADEWLDFLHAPAGLPINSHTPAEIAVSIAAQLIQCASNAMR